MTRMANYKSTNRFSRHRVKQTILLLLAIVLFSSLTLACPDTADDCITWGNTKSMKDHQAVLLTVRCQDYARFTMTAAEWGSITVDFLDGSTGKDSFAVFIDGTMIGQVDDSDKGDTLFAQRMVGTPSGYTGMHIVELKGTEKKTCDDDKLMLNWVALSHEKPGGGGSHVLWQLASIILPEEWLPVQEVPEFGTIALLVALVGGIAGFYFLRSR